MQRFAEAVPDLDKGLELSEESEQRYIRSRRAIALAKSEQVAKAVSEVDELTKTPFWPADFWYNFACVYAIASDKITDKKEEYAGRAIECLQNDVTIGLEAVDQIAKDTDLDPLRDREDFKKLVESLQN